MYNNTKKHHKLRSFTKIRIVLDSDSGYEASYAGMIVYAVSIFVIFIRGFFLVGLLLVSVLFVYVLFGVTTPTSTFIYSRAGAN